MTLWSLSGLVYKRGDSPLTGTQAAPGIPWVTGTWSEVTASGPRLGLSLVSLFILCPY